MTRGGGGARLCSPHVGSEVGLRFFPDFFLVGAPRCGTTAMSRYLGGHSEICFSRPKETHYFGYRDPSSAEELERDYLSLFFPHHDPTRHRAVGEGSVSYLYLPHAIDRIERWNPAARYLVMVRSPLELIPSYHGRLLFVLEEDERSLRRAWELQEARARGESIPRHCRDPRVLRYAEIGRLGAALQALLARVGRDRVHTVVYDDLKRDPGDVYRRTLRFLGVRDDGRTTFGHKTQSRSYRFRWLNELLYKPPAPLLRSAIREHRQSGAQPGRLRRARKRLRRWNRVDRPLAPPDPALRATLRDAFADDVALLGRLLDRDLGHWLA